MKPVKIKPRENHYHATALYRHGRLAALLFDDGPGVNWSVEEGKFFFFGERVLVIAPPKRGKRK